MTAPWTMRVGQGFDIHRFSDDPSRPLVLGGVGWVVATVLRNLTTNLLRSAGVDQIGNKAGLASTVQLSSLAGLLAGLLRQRDYLGVSFPLALRRIGEYLFNENRILFSLSWHWCLLYVVVVSLCALAVVLRKVRREEIAS